MREIIVEPFARLPGTVEIVGIGKVRQPWGNALEPEVEVVLAGRTPVGTFDPGPPHVAWVGCGQLDLLTIGSRWGAGLRERRHATMVCSTDVSWIGDEDLDGPVREVGTYRYVPTEPLADAPCFRVALSAFRSPRNTGGMPQVASVPKIELVRALFGINSTFLLEMFDGVRDGRVAPGRGLFDRQSSVFVPTEETVRIRCRRRLRRREAIAVAAYVSDPSIRAFYDGVFQTLRACQGISESKVLGGFTLMC